MKKAVIFIFLVVTSLTANAQITTVINSTYEPLSYDELLLVSRAQAARRAYNERVWAENIEKAYESLNRGDNAKFIAFTNYALQTGLYNAEVYYHRGLVFQLLGDYSNAKKELKKAKKKGYYLAESALRQLKAQRKK